MLGVEPVPERFYYSAEEAMRDSPLNEEQNENSRDQGQ